MYRITSRFGQFEEFRDAPHRGIDFAMELGEPIRSIRSGTISRIVDFHNTSGGKMIFVTWEDGKTAVYGHLSQYADSVRVGQHVNVGDLLGYAGSTGFSTGNHLHFAIKEGQRFLDPSPYINDIQNMNSLNHIVQQVVEKAPEIITKKVDFFHFMSQHMNGVSDTLTNLKLQFISNLSYDVVIIQILKNLGEFFSAKASLINLIITHIL
jgi:hypothetical protein